MVARIGFLMRAAACGCGLAFLAACGETPGYEAPSADNGPAVAQVKKLPRKAGERVAVTIYEFRSDVTEVPARGGTDMFVTALLQSGQFRVVERARLNDGVVREKQLNGGGLTTGNTAQQKLRGAQYIFEGAITEASPSENKRQATVGVGGAQLGGGTNRDVIGVDVRIVEVATGDVIDVVTVRKPIKSDSVGVSGIGNLVGGILQQHGTSTPYTPDASVQQDRKEGIDTALRAVIDQAVVELVNRFGS